MLEVAPEDLELAAGKVRVKGAPSRSLSLADMAVHSGGAFPGSPLPANLDEVGLEVTAFFRSEQSTYGKVDILRYVVVHDCGNVINPLIVEGQVQGGVAAGVGGALYEKLVYDEEGPPHVQTV